ncbi:hypothetical protein NFI96_002526, partial [Prochilodus magdalenae]
VLPARSWCSESRLGGITAAETKLAPTNYPQVSYKRHLPTTSNTHTPNSTMVKTKELSEDTRNRIVDLHQAGEGEATGSCCVIQLTDGSAPQTTLLTLASMFHSFFSYRCYADDTQHLLMDYSSNLKLNPSKTELLFISSTTRPHHDLAVSFWNSLITPTEDARSHVTLDDRLSYSAHTAKLTRSCGFTQLLVQSLVISRLDYCNLLLAGLPLQAIRPLQLVQNAAARLIFNLPTFTHMTPLLCPLHWLPVAERIRFKTLMLAYKAKNGPAPPYLMAMVKSRSVP